MSIFYDITCAARIHYNTHTELFPHLSLYTSLYFTIFRRYCTASHRAHSTWYFHSYSPEYLSTIIARYCRAYSVSAWWTWPIIRLLITFHCCDKHGLSLDRWTHIHGLCNERVSHMVVTLSQFFWWTCSVTR